MIETNEYLGNKWFFYALILSVVSALLFAGVHYLTGLIIFDTFSKIFLTLSPFFIVFYIMTVIINIKEQINGDIHD